MAAPATFGHDEPPPRPSPCPERSLTEYPDQPELSPESLKRAAATGVQWSFVATVFNQVGRLLFSLLLARLVGPKNFGIVAQATIYLTFTNLVLDQGFGKALIQKRTIDEDDVASVAVLNVAMIAVVVAATIVFAPLLADVFDTPELTTVLRVLTIDLIITGLAVVPTALVNRQLRFKELGIVQVIAVVASGIAGVLAAKLGAEYWALVVQTLVFDGLALIGLYLITDRTGRIRWASITRLRSMLRFSAYQFGSDILSFLGMNLDNILIAERLDARRLAYYAVAYRLLQIPQQLLGSVVNRVALPIFSRAQDDLQIVRSWFLAATRLAGAVLFPAFTLMIVGAPDGMVLVFGERWRGAIVPMQVLAAAGFSRGIRLLLPPLCQGLGRTDLNFAWSAMSLAAAVPAFVTGLHWGIVGVATGVAVVSTIMGIGHVKVTGRLIGVGLLDFLRLMLPLAVCAAVLAGTWIGIRTVLGDGTDPAGAITIVAATVGALVAYVGALMIVAPTTVAAVRQMLTLMRR